MNAKTGCQGIAQKALRVLGFAACAGLVQITAAAPDTYDTLWRNPAVNERIERNIDKHRKGDGELVIVDEAENPVKGAKVALRQTRHEFLFGCNAFVLGQLKPEELERRYESAFTNLFNFATVPFYWEGTEPARGELRYSEPARDIWRRPPPERFLPWAAANNITLKGHPLLWHAYNPAWLPKDANDLRGLYQKRFREIASRFASKIPIWDVVNESLVCPTNYPLFTRDRAYVAWAFAETAPLFPADRLMMINEVTSFNFPPAEKNPYFTQVKALLSQGAKLKGIGFQFHFFRREALDKHLAGANCDPARLLDLYENFAGFGLPLFITEITIPSAGEGGDTLQAKVVRDYYRLWFSAPMMAGITWWNLGDGTAVKGENEAKGGLMDSELQPKPAYHALDKLINQEWTTRAHAETDAQGRARFRGFFGHYQVEVESGGRKREFGIQHSRTGTQRHHLVLKP